MKQSDYLEYVRNRYREDLNEEELQRLVVLKEQVDAWVQGSLAFTGEGK